MAGPPPFLPWKIFKIQKTPKNSLSKTVCFFINFLALLLWMILFKKVVCGLSFSPDFKCHFKPYEWVFSTFLLLWKNFQQIVESYQMIFFARLKKEYHDYVCSGSVVIRRKNIKLYTNTYREFAWIWNTEFCVYQINICGYYLSIIFIDFFSFCCSVLQKGFRKSSSSFSFYGLEWDFFGKWKR